MTILRAFIAIEIPESIQTAIQKETFNLRSSADSTLVRWVVPANIHLTLKFLGDVSTTNLQFIKQMLTQECAQHFAFDLQIGKLGSFPTIKRPRVIWVGVQAPMEFEILQQVIESGAARLGYTPETGGFSPHLTIGRVRQNLMDSGMQKLRAALTSNHVGMLGAVKVNAVHLYKSDLQSNGSVYTQLSSAPLKTP